MINGTHANSFAKKTIDATNLLDMQKGDNHVFHPIAADRRMVEIYKTGNYLISKYQIRRNNKN